MKKMLCLSAVLILSFTGALLGCERSPANSREAAPVVAAPARPTRIVFVGKEKACACTRKAIDAGWEVLQAAVGKPASLPIEVLLADTDADRVDEYSQKKAYFTLPAIYFLDGENLVEMLQGEVTREQITKALGVSQGT